MASKVVTLAQVGIAVDAERFAVAQTTCACWWCAESTRVVGLVVDVGHRVRQEDEWVVTPYASLLSGIRDLNDVAFGVVNAISPWMQRLYSASARSSYVGNACESCRALQPDAHLQTGPGSAFSPDSQKNAAAIAMRWFDAPLRAMCEGKSVGIPWISERPRMAAGRVQ